MMYHIIRSKRKTIALVVSADGVLTVRAPMMTTLRYIENLVLGKKAWIQAKMEQARKNSELVKIRKFNDGEEFLYLGKMRKLRVGDSSALPLAERRAKVVAWYREKAREKITERAEHYSKMTGWKFTSLKITSAMGRWGSCGPKGSINFTWRLIMAPLEVVDYVVVHELAHLIEKNHSKRFWSKVEAIVLDYRERRKWLRAKENRAHFKI